MELVLVGLVAGGALLGVWVITNRRHVRAHRGRDADWIGAEAQPELWTSAARCPFCTERGGLLETHGEQMWFVCLSCRRRHVRNEPG